MLPVLHSNCLLLVVAQLGTQYLAICQNGDECVETTKTLYVMQTRHTRPTYTSL